MSRLAWLLMPLAMGRLRSGARNATRRLAYLAAAALLGLIALVFALTTITVLIAGEIGLLAALGAMTAAAALGALIIIVVIRVRDRRRREQASLLTRVPPSAYASIISRAIVAMGPRGGRILGLGLLATGLIAVFLRGGDDDA